MGSRSRGEDGDILGHGCRQVNNLSASSKMGEVDKLPLEGLNDLSVRSGSRCRERRHDVFQTSARCTMNSLAPRISRLRLVLRVQSVFSFYT